MNKTESWKLTDDYAAFAEDALTQGDITQAVFYKTMLQIATEYIRDHGDEEACMMALNRVDPEFILNAGPEAESDSFFATSLVELAYHLERRGITFEVPVRPTQKEALA